MNIPNEDDLLIINESDWLLELMIADGSGRVPGEETDDERAAAQMAASSKTLAELESDPWIGGDVI